MLIGADPDRHLDREEAEGLIGDAVFEEARYFMRRAFIPKLAEARIRKLNRLREAEVALLQSDAQTDSPMAVGPQIDFSQAADLDTAVKLYHRCESWVKRKLSAVERPAEAALLYTYWTEVYQRFAHRFCTLYEAFFPGRTPKSGVKLSENIDFNEVYAELKSGSGPEGALHRYYSRLKKLI